jgi:hypothetical protein
VLPVSAVQQMVSLNWSDGLSATWPSGCSVILPHGGNNGAIRRRCTVHSMRTCVTPSNSSRGGRWRRAAIGDMTVHLVARQSLEEFVANGFTKE